MPSFAVRRLPCILAAVLCLATLSSYAAETAPARFAGEAAALHAAASKAAPAEGADISVLEEEERYVFDAEGKSVHTRYIVFKVLTQNGAENWDSIAIAWQPWHEGRPAIRARVITPDLAVHELDQKTITDAPTDETDSNLYSDSRVMRAPLPAIAPGSVVEQEIVITERAPFFGAGTVARYYTARMSVPVYRSRLVVEAPSSIPLRYVTHLLPGLQPQRTEENGVVKLVFEHGPTPAQERVETNLPRDVPAFPEIVFSTGTSWQQVAEQYGSIVDTHVGNADVKALVSKLTQGKQSREDKARAILDYVSRNIRYTGIEFGEAAIVPHSPAETLTRKYGDCKDKSTLVVSMLRAAGIPAYIALLNAGGRMDVPPELPGMGLFDHAIVYAPGEPDIWIDATDRYARLGQLPAGDQGRLALITRAGTKGLIQIPESTSRDNVVIENREIFLSENGPARVVETTMPKGCFESEYRGFYADQQDKSVRENLTNYMKSQYLAEKLDTMSRSDPADLSRQFELMLESRKAKRGITELDNAVAAIRLEGLFYRLPQELTTREGKDEDQDEDKPKKPRIADHQLSRPFVVEWRYRIVPPAGFQPKALPPNAKLSLGPALLTQEYAAEADHSVRAILRFDTVQSRFTVAEATEMRNKIAELREGTAIMVNFEPTALALMREGKTREGFQAYRNLVAQHPKEAVHHLQIAKALLEAGLGLAAREEAQLAVKLEPESALAHKTLAEILQYDSVGRRLRPGSDYAGAAAAYRAAVKLDPDDTETAANLAILLEYNDQGSRYAPDAHLKEAVAEYRKLGQEKLASVGIPANLAFALFYSGEFEEARKVAETLNPQPKPLIAACEAVINGAAAAIADANKRTNGEGDFKTIAKTAGEMLMNVRKYAVAADLMQAGASGENASRTIALASMLRKIQPREQIPAGNDVAGVLTRFFTASFTPDITVEKLLPLLSKNARSVTQNMDEEERKRLTKAGKELRSRLARSGASMDVTLDLLMHALEPKPEGNDATGYRVKLQFFSGAKMTVFVVKEAGEYKILDTMEKPNAIGLEILDRVAANDLVGASTLLDWVREEQKLQGGDDPLTGEAFPRFWTKGRAGDAAQMKLAAAALLAQTEPTARVGIPILEESKKAATTDVAKTNINLALLMGYWNIEDWTKQDTIATELLQLYPESPYAFYAKSHALRALGRFDEANDLANARLKQMPNDMDAVRGLILNAAFREDYATAYRISSELLPEGKAEVVDLNGRAWHTLFFQREGGPDIDSAIKATQLAQNNYHLLHTLGCIYAEVGRTKDAREVLVQAMDLQELDEPNPDYWYAFGRIAEQFGERDAALANYGKVTRPELAMMIADSSYRLAQNRLKVLQPETKTKTASR